MALIEVKNLIKIFEVGGEQVKALDGVSLKIEQGEFAAIIGPSGSGKSTLMHLLGLLDKQTSGEYYLDGKLTDNLNDSERSLLRNKKIGFIFQNFYLLGRATALRNAMIPLVYAANYDPEMSSAKMKQMAVEALERVGLGHRLNHKPNELSGGQRQRVAIARALVNNPSIIFADEPTGNLDSATGQDILRIFQELNQQGVTVVLVTHDQKVASTAKRIIRVFDGKIEEGTSHVAS